MTMEVIQHIELGSDAANITFSSIPQTFTDLMIQFSARTARSNHSDEILLRVNGSSSNLSGRYLSGDGASVGSGSVPVVFAGYAASAFATSNTFGSNMVYIPNYTSSSAKSISSEGSGENNATNSARLIFAGLWNSTAAITSLTLVSDTSNNLIAGSSATLYGIKRFNTTLSPKATGGAISYDSVNNKWVHAFYTSGTFTPTENLTGVEYLVIAGGGGSGRQSGGGGAGGYRSSVVGQMSGGGASAEATLSLTSGTNYTVTVGAGGPGTTSASGFAGSNGSNSVFGSITATGGGGGGTGSAAPTSGGSGGGGGVHNASVAGASGTANQGYAGGNNSSGSPFPGGGGGGAGGTGVNGSGSTGGNGGAGVSSNITGTAVIRAGGGGAGVYTAGNVAGTGSAGGGNGAAGNGIPTSAAANTGSGGGGGGDATQNGGSGGSGVVIVRYSA